MAWGNIFNIGTSENREELVKNGVEQDVVAVASTVALSVAVTSTVALTLSNTEKEKSEVLTSVRSTSSHLLIMSVEVRGPSGVSVQVGPKVGDRSDCRDSPTGTAGGEEATEPGYPLADSGDRFPGTCCLAALTRNVAARSDVTRLPAPLHDCDYGNQTSHTHNIRDLCLDHDLGATLHQDLDAV